VPPRCEYSCGSHKLGQTKKSVYSFDTHKLFIYVMYYPDARSPDRTDICSL
jgi:hypothetical protein